MLIGPEAENLSVENEFDLKEKPFNFYNLRK